MSAPRGNPETPPDLAGTQAVVSLLKQRGESKEEGVASIWKARTMFDAVVLVSDAVSRIIAPPGETRIHTDALVSGDLDVVNLDAEQTPVELLPPETLVFLLGSRYCETDRLSEIAWQLFGNAPMGWGRVQAICDFVHNHLTFGYQYARATRTAWEGYQERVGVCRDFAHLAVTFCRCMNIPARYCTGYLRDIGVPPSDAPVDFSGWFEAFLDGEWYTFDARHNTPRIGRVLIAYGRDAADVAISTAFGASALKKFWVRTDEVSVGA